MKRSRRRWLERVVPEPASNVRQAALLVHALGRADRDWLLAALPVSARGALAQPLGELEGLGIPRDPQWLRSVLDEAAAAPAPREPATQLQHLSPLQVEALAAALEREPPSLAARLLRLREWPWRAALLAYWEPATLRAVQGCGPLPSAPSLDAALCAMAWRCASANLGTQARTHRGRWPTLLRLVRRLGREGGTT